MKIQVNGEREEIDSGLSIAEFLQAKDQKLAELVVEYNEDILPREKWKEVKLKSGDQLEVLKFMGGGVWKC